MTANSDSGFSAFLAVWKSAFAKLLMQSGAANVSTPDVEGVSLASAENPEMVAMRFSGGGCLKGQLQWSVPKVVALQSAQLLMAEALDASAEFTATHLDGFQEFMRQAAGEAAMAWKEARGEATELAHQVEVGEAFKSQGSASFSLESDKTHDLQLRLDVDAEMLRTLEEAPAESGEGEAISTPEATAPGKTCSNLDLILDVQLEATIRFGEREMLLQDVFGLTPGAVVELDQLVNEPAELLVAGRVVAKGEVVVVDGNFGLRVTEVLSRAERAAALSLG